MGVTKWLSSQRKSFAASKAISRGKRSLPLCRHRRIVTSISSRGACACRCATFLCGGLIKVLSELRRPKPDRKVVAFIAAQPLDLLYVSAVTLAEIRFGIEVVTDATKLPVMAALDFAAQLHRHRLLAVADAQLHKALVVRPHA